MEQIGFECENHKIRTVSSMKVALNPCDNKRLIQSGMINTLAIGHHRAMK
jgi:hypothetical protein